MNKIKILLSCIIIFSIFSCGNDDDNTITEPEDGREVWIVNEGGFLAGNSSLSVYYPDSLKVNNSVYAGLNGSSLGDVFQMIAFHNSSAYLVVNGSQKIVEINQKSKLEQKQFTGFTSPNHMLLVSDEKAYVTDLSSENISVINVNTGALIKTIAIPGQIEQLIKVGDEILVSNVTFFQSTDLRKQLFVLNPNTDLIIDSIEVGVSPSAMVLDNDNKLWVICNGIFGGEPGSLHQIDVANRKELKSFNLGAHGVSSNRMAYDAINDQLYFDGPQGVYQLSTAATNLPSSLFIDLSAELSYLYGLNVDPINGDIYIGDAKNFSSVGKVFVYSSTGTKITEFETGVSPKAFYFVD